MKRILLSALAAGTLGCPPLTSCIAAGARVRTPNGLREIESLLPGDELECVDPRNGERVTARITFVRSARRECVRLPFAGGELVCTTDHPLWCPDTKAWAPAGDWALGERLRLLFVEDERVRTVEVQTEEAVYAGVHDVYDLSVDHPLHNFVAEGVLVHNKPPARESCLLEDGGFEFRSTPCLCPDGFSEGVVFCQPDGRAVCMNCADGGVEPEEDGGEGADGGG